MTADPVAAARSRPAWKRALRMRAELLELRWSVHHWEASVQEFAACGKDATDAGYALAEREVIAARGRVAEAEQELSRRLAQLAGMVAPGLRGTGRAELVATLASALVQDAEALTPGRTGQPREVVQVPQVLPPGELIQVLDQEARAMHNRIALSLHRRYLISDRPPRSGPTISRAVRQAVQQAAQSEGRLSEPLDQAPPRSSTAHGELDEARLTLYAAAQEVCQRLLAGQPHELALDAYQGASRRYAQAEAVLARHRVRDHTGPYLHGEILSVRQEHVEYDEDGQFLAYHGMTQWYTRLIVVYAGNGHEVVIANARELEARTLVPVGPAWGDLCRWLEHNAERQGGRRRGRPQADDEHLIYRAQEGSLVLREAIRREYPGLPRALECLRRSLSVSDVEPWELGEHPAPGFHPAEEQAKAPA